MIQANLLYDGNIHCEGHSVVSKFKLPAYSNLSLSFVLQWVVLHVVGWLIVWFIFDTLKIFNPFVFINAVLIGLIFGMIASVIQERLVFRTFHHSIPYWYPLSFIGWLLSGILLHLTVTRNSGDLQMQIFLFFLIPATLQWLGLRKFVSQGWMWILANGIGGLVFVVGILMNIRADELMALTFGGILQTVITGAIMYWIISVAIPKVR